ncbi:zinc finger CCHC domain-containing protein 18-like [Sphaeramia orbicularis]|uniref:zinc finger CCHC domain-containing protein 18-like n=1 Tax=Sphaeramia orbicularis TaxID=375764 RepID=UPI00117F5AE9|nr:zinc finger CCHC domain-containing protein 18-like [Sphaeramia orbicularis]
MIVEHVVRSESPVSVMNASFRLRQFSGKTLCPSHEVDFDTWRNSVELILKDPALSDLQHSRRILDSLVPPAANVVKPLGPNALLAAYLKLLDSAFGIVEDGDELFAVFLSTLQDSGEKPSQYLHRLQTVLTQALKRGGVSANEVDRHLLRQFCRGCWDNVLIADLQLERKKDKPPPFSELLLQLRVEDKQSTKETCKKKHLGAAKQKASAHLLAASSLENDTSIENDITEMKKQVTELQSQLAQLKTLKAESNESSPKTVVTELKKKVTELQSQLTSRKIQKNTPKKKTNASKPGAKHQPMSKEPGSSPAVDKRPSNRPRPWHCFQCGEDGHIVSVCPNESNPSLVAAKKAQLKEKQSLWDSQNGSTSSQHLN